VFGAVLTSQEGVMRAAVIAMVAVGVFSAGSARAADNKELIVGTWEIVHSDAKDIPPGTKLEFTEKGKVNLTVVVDGKEVTVDAGGYKIEKDMVTLTGKGGNKNDKGRICLLNKSSFVLNDEVEDKVMVMKRQKAK
jgi:uncharacterized protein (TIGR03066 family)